LVSVFGVESCGLLFFFVGSWVQKSPGSKQVRMKGNSLERPACARRQQCFSSQITWRISCNVFSMRSTLSS